MRGDKDSIHTINVKPKETTTHTHTLRKAKDNHIHKTLPQFYFWFWMVYARIRVGVSTHVQNQLLYNHIELSRLSRLLFLLYIKMWNGFIAKHELRAHRQVAVDVGYIVVVYRAIARSHCPTFHGRDLFCPQNTVIILKLWSGLSHLRHNDWIYFRITQNVDLFFVAHAHSLF